MNANSRHRTSQQHPDIPFAPRLAAMVAMAALSIPAPASADTPADTSDWKCTQCPFLQGYESNVEVGALSASGANAYFGRYTGIDHPGTYADVGASGQLRSDDGSYANYDLEQLGLASREGYVEGGREGKYDLRVSYDGQPARLYDTAVTPYQASGTNLGLPAGWIAAGGTAGMSALGSSLASAPIETDRRTVALLGRFFASPGWTLFGEFRRQEKVGTELTSASFLTEAVQLSQPVDYVTDSFEGGVAWSGRIASLRVSYLGSWFEDDNDALTQRSAQQQPAAGRCIRQSAAALVRDHVDFRGLARLASAGRWLSARQHLGRCRRAGPGIARWRCASVALRTATGVAAAAEAQHPGQCGL
jgi:hypothetical protein